MPRITIHDFRAVLADGADANATVRVYRELARRSEVAHGMLHSEWTVWPPAAQA